MNESKNQNRFLPVIRWIARIWSILSLAFLLLFFGASIISSVGTSTFAFKDVYQFLFFPISCWIDTRLEVGRTRWNYCNR